MPPLNDILLVATAILVVMAPMTASFLQCWADRARGGAPGMPNGRSYCDSCGKTLGAIDLVPVLSWLWNRGRARCCGERLSPALLWPEAGALICALWGAWVSSLPLAIVSVGLVWALQVIILMHQARPDVAQGVVGLLTLTALGLAAGGLTAPLWWHLAGVAAGLAGIAVCRASAAFRPFSDASTVLVAAGAFLGVPLLCISVLLGTGLAAAFWVIAPKVGLHQPDWPHAAVFGISAGFWLTWLYGVAV